MAGWRLGFLVWVCALAALTAWRTPIWRDEVALWTESAARAPDKPRSAVNLGVLAQQRGDRQEARRQYLIAEALVERGTRRCREREDTWVYTTFNLATLDLIEGRYTDASQRARAILTQFPAFDAARRLERAAEAATP